MRCPVFILSGTRDEHTTADETRALFAQAPEPKRLWLVPGAAHVDLHRFASREYERRVLGFLEESVVRPFRAFSSGIRLPVQSGKSFASSLTPRCLPASSQKTERKSVVTGRSRPS